MGETPVFPAGSFAFVSIFTLFSGPCHEVVVYRKNGWNSHMFSVLEDVILE